MQQFFYDGQIRRFLQQFIRMLSGFQVESGYDDTGAPAYVTVPIRYGNASKQAATIIQENSANSLPCAPMMTVYINNLRYRREDLQEPYFVERKYIHQREYDPATALYQNTQGNAFTVEKHMPAPYELGLTLDIWTTNMNHKLQIIEQIAPLFNPSLEIQSDTNYLDWTSLSTVTLDPNIKFSSRTIDSADTEFDFSTMSFTLPIWISMPARVTAEGVIHKVIANVYNDENDLIDAINGNDILTGQRVIVTAHGYQVLLYKEVEDYTLQILPVSNPRIVYNESLDIIPEQTSSLDWHVVIAEYGKLRDGISKIKLRQPDGTDVEGTVSYHPVHNDLLIFVANEDTVPADTLDPVDAVINPLRSGPEEGLPYAAVGTRYLLTESIGYGPDNELEDSLHSDPIAEAWMGDDGTELIAHANDIIEFDGSKWNVAFDSTDPDNIDSLQYVSNITTLLQYKWTDGEWVRSYEGIYDGGLWSIVL